MKIVRTKEDIVGDMYCAATKENYEKLIELGYKRWECSFNNFYDHAYYKLTAIIQLTCKSMDMYWYDERDKKGAEFKFDESDNKFSVSQVGFVEPTSFDAKIFSCYKSQTTTEYIGVVNKNIPAKWDFNGNCLNPSLGYSLYKEYKQVLYTKENAPGFLPKQKFKVSCTSGMSKSLEEGGWRKATNNEIQAFMS